MKNYCKASTLITLLIVLNIAPSYALAGVDYDCRINDQLQDLRVDLTVYASTGGFGAVMNGHYMGQDSPSIMFPISKKYLSLDALTELVSKKVVTGLGVTTENFIDAATFLPVNRIVSVPPYMVTLPAYTWVKIWLTHAEEIKLVKIENYTTRCENIVLNQ